MLKRDVKPEELPVPCSCCGAPAAAPVWQLQLCDACIGRWHAEAEMPAAVDLRHTCGAFDRSGQWKTAGDEANCPACKPYREATARWLELRSAA